MERVGVAELPLHYGRAPKWLFQRMVKLGKSITTLIVNEYGKGEFLERLADPFWLNALGCALGYDWHSSGLTTVVLGALKEALARADLGIVVCGGKGKTSRKTPEEIERASEILSFRSEEIERLKYCSKIAAKIDNAVVQDGYTLYHHAFIVSEDGEWVVVQQGMNQLNRFARRYHWLSKKIKNLVVEPHSAIVGKKEDVVLDLTARESEDTRKCSVDLVKDNPEHLRKYLRDIRQKSLWEFSKDSDIQLKFLRLPREHDFSLQDLDDRVIKSLKLAYELQPQDFEELVSIKGIGPKCIRALALISNLIYGTEVSYRDPCKFSFAHGGKDGVPYPVDLKTYDHSIKFLEDAIKQTELSNFEKVRALKRLSELVEEIEARAQS